MRQKLGTSERRTCREVGVARSTQQYKSKLQNDDDLRLALIRLAKQYGRYGYRKIGELLAAEGWRVNHKKIERLWREEGLQLPARHKKRKRLYHHDASVIRLRPKYPSGDALTTTLDHWSERSVDFLGCFVVDNELTFAQCGLFRKGSWDEPALAGVRCARVVPWCRRRSNQLNSMR